MQLKCESCDIMYMAQQVEFTDICSDLLDVDWTRKRHYFHRFRRKSEKFGEIGR